MSAEQAVQASSSLKNIINEGGMNYEKISSQLATLTEQGRWMAREITALRADVKKLEAAHWKIIGFASCIAFISSLLVKFVKEGW